MIIKKVSRIFFVIVLLISLPLFLGLGCKNNPIASKPQTKVLRFWSVFNDSDFFEPIIKAYQDQNPNIKIEYKKLEYAEYEEGVLNALASGRGPDIWSLYYTWYPRHKDKLVPAPANLLTKDNFEEVFVKGAVPDLLIDDKIYGLPLAIDNLVLFYNEDIFNNAGIVKPPVTWEELMTDAAKITTLADDKIKLSGVALGAADNINRAGDILAVLMLQSGANIVDHKTKSSGLLQTAKDQTGKSVNPSLNSLSFYTDFANPQKTSFAWDISQDYSIDAFGLGKTAMMINYSYHIPTIKLKAPNLNFKVSALPQINKLQKVNYPSFWAQSVASASKYPEEAWKFLVFLASKSSNELYVKASVRASARRDVIESQQEDAGIGLIATQNLTVKTWYQVGREEAMQEIFNKMIRDVNLGRKTKEDALRAANDQINAILR